MATVYIPPKQSIAGQLFDVFFLIALLFGALFLPIWLGIAVPSRVEKLPEGVRVMVQDGTLTAGHARALVGRDDAEALAKRIVAEGLNVRAVESLVQRENSSEERDTGSGRRVREKDADTRAFERDLRDLLDLSVEIKRGSGESGNLIIKYANFEQLEHIRKCIARGAALG